MSGVRWGFATAAAVCALIALQACSAPTQQAAPQPPPAPAVAPAQPPAAPVAISRGTPVETEVSLENDGGTFVVPVSINDAITLKFTLDSGASDVAIPADVVRTLVRTGTITNDDFIGSKTFTLADGSTVPSVEFRIRTLKVGTLVLHDVTASVADARGPLLLGQTFLSRLSNWSIDNSRQLLVLKANTAEGQVTAAATNAPPVAAAPRDGAGTLASSTAANGDQSEPTERAQEYFAAWSNPQDPDGAGIRRFYAPVVKFYGKPIAVADLMAEKVKFARRWPYRNYSPRPASMVTQCNSGICLVSGIVDWHAADASSGRQSSGVASFAMQFTGGQIDSEASSVLARQQ